MNDTALRLENGSQAGWDETTRSEQGSFIDLWEVWASIYRSRYWVGAIFVICLTVAAAFTAFATKYYSSTTIIEVKQEAEKVLGTEADREGMASKMDADRFLQTQLDIIRSRSTTNAVAQSLRLYRGDAFLETMKVSPENARRGVLSADEAKRELVIETLQKRVNVTYSGDTRLAKITFVAPDPRLAAQIANSFADNFIRGTLARKLESSSYALEFLRSQLNEAQARLEQSEQSAINYARSQQIVDASNAAGDGAQNNQPQSLVTAQLVQLNTSLAEATANRIASQQKWQRTAQMPLLSIPDVLTNQAIQGMVQKRAEAQSEYREQLATRRPDHPSVIQALGNVTSYDTQINSLAGSIRSSIKSQYDVARANEAQVLATVNGLKGDTLTEQNQSIQLSILRRAAETNRAQYDALMKRFNEINAESGVQTNNISIVDRAQVPTLPSWPRLWWSLAVAAAFAILVSFVLIIIRAQLFDAVRTPADITDRLGLPVLGVIPNEPDLLTLIEDMKSMVSEAFGSIRTGLSLSSEHGAPRTMMVTSAQMGEGKSSTCCALAISFARLGKRVIVVDVDLRRPNVHALFGQDNKLGLSNYLSGQVDLHQCIRKTAFDHVDIICAGDIPPNPSEQLSSSALPPMIAKLSSEYDLVLLDCAPVLGLADAIIVSNLVEATLFVIEANRNTVRGAAGAISRLAQSNGVITGVVLTKFDAGKFGYGDQYGYGYGYSYDTQTRDRA